jgi:hypothetical protein
VNTVRDIAPYLSVGLAVAALVLAVLLLLLWLRVRRLRRAQLVVMGRSEQRDIVAHTEHLDSQVRNLRGAVEILTDKLDEHKHHLDRALTNRAVVRYDAFRDTGGEQSASIALVDNYRSGLVMSAISARDFARIYMKTLDQGVPDRELSPEEAEAVAKAVPRPLNEQGDAAGPAAARPPAPAHLPTTDELPAAGSANENAAIEAGAAEAPAESRPAAGGGEPRRRIPLDDDWGEV